MKAKIFFLSVCLSVPALFFGVTDSDSATDLESADIAQSYQDCQPLPPPSGTIVNVSTVSELQNAVNTATSGDTILIADGVYNLDGVYLRMETPHVALRSASGNRDAVVLDGNYTTTEIIQVVASDVTIADMTLREAYYHPIHVMSADAGDTVNTHIYNVHIVDPGEQAIKINPGAEGTYADDGLIACSHIELTDAGRPHIRNDCYTGGIDAHQAEGWVIRDNLIEGFWCESGLSEHGIHLWRGSRDTLVERNVLNNNARGIGFGLAISGDARTYPDNPCPGANGGYVDHYGGIVRNNFVFANQEGLFVSEYGFDCGICLWQACGAQAFHNTVISTEAPFSSIEWRFDNTDVEIKNNLVSHNLRDRGGISVLVDNLEDTPMALFVDGSHGDLHLLETATSAIDQAGPLTEVTDDIDGDIRSAGLAPDIGADEYTPNITLFGDELATDFGDSGLWHHNGAWSRMTTWNADDGLAGWSGGLAVDFDGNGVWSNDGSSWIRITTWSSVNAGLTGWRGGLAADFGANGLWNFDGSAWNKMTNWNVNNAFTGWSGGLAVDFPIEGLWNFDGSSWIRLTTWNAGSAGLTGWNGSLAADFNSSGLWNFDGSAWQRLTTWDPEGDLTGWPGGLAVDFGADGLWSYDGLAWTRLTTWNAGVMTGVSNGLVVDFGANGMWKYDGSSWSKLTNWDPENMSDCDLN